VRGDPGYSSRNSEREHTSGHDPRRSEQAGSKTHDDEARAMSDLLLSIAKLGLVVGVLVAVMRLFIGNYGFFFLGFVFTDFPRKMTIWSVLVAAAIAFGLSFLVTYVLTCSGGT